MSISDYYFDVVPTVNHTRLVLGRPLVELRLQDGYVLRRTRLAPLVLLLDALHRRGLKFWKLWCAIRAEMYSMYRNIKFLRATNIHYCSPLFLNQLRGENLWNQNN